MKHLREIDGEENKCESCNIKLDEKTVTREELEKKQKDQSTRIIETNPGEYKTLHKLHS